MTVVVPAGSDVVIADTLVVFVTYLLTYLLTAGKIEKQLRAQ